VESAINVPKPLQEPRVPIMVGGNGPNVTWRLAARYADELNLDGLTPDEVQTALPVVRSRCDEIGRDPESLPISVHIFRSRLGTAGAERVERLSAYRELGVSRVMTMMTAAADDLEAVDAFAEDCRLAGLEPFTGPGTSS
jgi:alkanesulfonate monooxygenase SsuD/methylene tetrahydromethanopterin reductase-like flavin-dependent oxidoreductase (luciferase family)